MSRFILVDKWRDIVHVCESKEEAEWYKDRWLENVGAELTIYERAR